MEIYACGSNHFGQLSSFPKSDGPKVSDQRDGCFKIPVPLHKTTTEHMMKASFTWSRLIATFKTDDGHVTHVSGFSKPKCSDVSPSVTESHHTFNNTEVVAVTDCNAYLSLPGVSTPSLLLRDGKSNLDPVNLDTPGGKDLIVSVCAGGHQDLYAAYDNLSFGKLSIDRGALSDSEKESKEPVLTLLLCPIDSGLSISAVCCGKEHVLLLSKHGTVYSYGLGSRGQLGHGTVDKESTPRLIEALEGLKIKAISAGGWHSAAIEDSGDLYTWGWNESGQLGQAALNVSSDVRPKAIESQEFVGIQAEPKCAFDVDLDVRLSAVSCGTRHTLCLTDKGQVLSTGWNGYGQLGLGCVEAVDKFTLVDTIKETCIQIFAAQWNSLFVCRVKVK